MSKKVLVIVGLAAVIAASTGVALVSTGSNSDNDNSKVSIQNTEAVSEVSTSVSYSSEKSEPTDSEMSSEFPDKTEPNSTDNSVLSNDSLIDSSFRIIRVVERDTGEEQLPQVIFGKYYGACFLNLYADGSVELCLSPSTGKTEKGVYSIDNNKLFVDFGKDRSAEYSIVYDENTVSGIIVNSGNYDIYFE